MPWAFFIGIDTYQNVFYALKEIPRGAKDTKGSNLIILPCGFTSPCPGEVKSGSQTQIGQVTVIEKKSLIILTCSAIFPWMYKETQHFSNSKGKCVVVARERTRTPA